MQTGGASNPSSASSAAESTSSGSPSLLGASPLVLVALAGIALLSAAPLFVQYNKKRRNLLHLTGSEEIFKLIIESAPQAAQTPTGLNSPPTPQPTENTTPAAPLRTKAEILAELRRILKAYPDSILTTRDLNDNTPLMLSLHHGLPEVGSEILFGAQPHQVKSAPSVSTEKALEQLREVLKLHKNNMLWSIFHSASYGGCIGFVQQVFDSIPIPANELQRQRREEEIAAWLNEADINGWTPLVIATSKGNLELVRLLIKRGAKADVKTSQDLTPLMIAANNGYLEIVKELFRASPLDLTVQSASSLDTALHLAIRSKHSEIAMEILHPSCSPTGAIPTTPNHLELLSIANKTGSTPLHAAAFVGDLPLVKELLRLGADANATRGDGFTALHLTCLQNHIEVAKLLIPCTAINTESRFGTTALHEAARRGFYALVDLLLVNGANPNLEDNDQMTALHAACSGVGSFNKEKQAAQRGAVDIDQVDHLRVVERLIEAGADLVKLDRGGSNALHVAACCGPPAKELIERLLEAGVDMTLENYLGWTPLHFALDTQRTQKVPNPVVDDFKAFAREHLPEFLETFDAEKPRAQRKNLPDDAIDPSKPKITLEAVASSIRAGIYKRVIVLTGAGISVSAGIPDFRSATGLYNSTLVKDLQLGSPQDVFSLPVFMQDPRPFFRIAEKVFLPVVTGAVRPTAAHWFIKLLHSNGMLLRNYTQNIDGLERKTGIPVESLVESHGTFATASCPSCHTPVPEEEMAERFWSKVQNNEVPLCSRCNRAVKPDVTFFGEALPAQFFKLKLPDFKKCDLLIVMGTSLQVYPFAGLVNDVPRDTPRILINREAVGPFVKCGNRDISLLGDCDEVVESLIRTLGWTKEYEKLKNANLPPISEPSTALSEVERPEPSQVKVWDGVVRNSESD